MSQKTPTPFDTLLGTYIIPATIHHNSYTKKSYLFVGDRWVEMGDIEFVFVRVTEDSGYIEIHPPNSASYAEEHKDEGALDWLRWGPRVN